MDSPSPSPIQEALIIRLRHGIFGYTALDDSYCAAIINWMARRHGWAIERDWIITTNGVMQAINLVVQKMTQPGDNIIVQPPVFAPIGQAVSNSGRASARHRFLLGED